MLLIFIFKKARMMMFLPLCFLVKTRQTIYMTLEGQGQNFTSGQGNVITKTNYVADQSMRLDKTNILTAIHSFISFWTRYW